MNVIAVVVGQDYEDNNKSLCVFYFEKIGEVNGEINFVITDA